jgi:hypothetical protein
LLKKKDMSDSPVPIAIGTRPNDDNLGHNFCFLTKEGIGYCDTKI